MEAWRAVVGYEGLYEVSDAGRVRSVDRRVVRQYAGGPRVTFYKGRVLRPSLNNVTGYWQVVVSKQGTISTFTVHRLVAIVFLGSRPAGMEVAHHDGDKKNCRLSNLRYTTPVDNAADKVRHGTQVRGVTQGHSVLTEEAVREIRTRLQRGKITFRALAKEYGVHAVTIADAVYRKTWAHVK